MKVYLVFFTIIIFYPDSQIWDLKSIIFLLFYVHKPTALSHYQ